MKFRPLPCSLLLAALCVVPLRAQSATGYQALVAARQYRETVVADIVAGRAQPEDALTRLKSRRAASAQGLDSEADLGLAAMGIGQRLLAAGRPDKAEKFFLEAERSLDTAIKRLSDSAAGQKAMLLKNLAFIRTQYLGKSAVAQDDLTEAARLRPNDEQLKSLRRTLAKERGENAVKLQRKKRS